ncbi:hypothetical protein D1872_89910 [compost metagenome]
MVDLSKILAIDPSGNFSDREGKGTTGWALFEGDDLVEFGRIEAKDFGIIESYWQAHLDLMYQKLKSDYFVHTIVCESYKLQPGKAMAQSWSALETPQLIGAMRMYNYAENGLLADFVFQDPSIKTRFSDEILVKMGVAEKRGNKHYVLDRPSVIHERDAIRHGLYYLKYGKEK